MIFSEEEKKLLDSYVTSTDANVFAVRGMQGMVGAAYARYSRAQGGFREILLKEFIKEGNIDPKHADQLIERILIAYGDDSVGELEGAHVSFEQISMLATKEIEDRRIGGSPIEQSTRYVFYDQKDNGHWRFLHHPSLMEAPFGKQYHDTMEHIFKTYASLVEPMKEYFGNLKSLGDAEYDINGDGAKERYRDLSDEKQQKAFKLTYNIDLRTKACDTLRALLPLATLTNVGIFGNGRFYQHVISHMLTSDIPEVSEIAQKTLAATTQVIPQYVRRAKRNDYMKKIKREMFALATEFFESSEPEGAKQMPEVKLLASMKNFDNQVIAAMIFPYTNVSLTTMRKKVATLPEAQKAEIFSKYIGDRKNRRDRPGRALEEGYPLTFELVTNWGVYKDLMRHRMNTQQRQLFTTKIGFQMPSELGQAGLAGRVSECVERADKLFDAVENPELKQYAVLHGHYVRWSLGMNAREAMHLIELRSTPQGHAQYRLLVQKMHREIEKKYPKLASAMKFVDHAEYFWARGDSEARQRVKEEALEKTSSRIEHKANKTTAL